MQETQSSPYAKEGFRGVFLKGRMLEGRLSLPSLNFIVPHDWGTSGG